MGEAYPIYTMVWVCSEGRRRFRRRHWGWWRARSGNSFIRGSVWVPLAPRRRVAEATTGLSPSHGPAKLARLMTVTWMLISYLIGFSQLVRSPTKLSDDRIRTRNQTTRPTPGVKRALAHLTLPTPRTSPDLLHVAHLTYHRAIKNFKIPHVQLKQLLKTTI